MVSAKVVLTQPLKRTGSLSRLPAADITCCWTTRPEARDPSPSNWLPSALAGCTAFDVITILRQKYHQMVTGYEVRVEADQAERPPQVFTKVRIHHVVTGFEIDPKAVEEAIRLSEEKYCSVGAMVKQTATLETTYRNCRRNIRMLAGCSRRWFKGDRELADRDTVHRPL